MKNEQVCINCINFTWRENLGQSRFYAGPVKRRRAPCVTGRWRV